VNENVAVPLSCNGLRVLEEVIQLLVQHIISLSIF